VIHRDLDMAPTLGLLLRGAALLWALAGIVATPLSAQQTDASKSSASTIFTIGGFGTYAPKFEGSKSYEAGFKPSFSFRSPGARVWLDLPHDGLDFELIETSNFRAGPVGNFRFQRDTDSLVRGFKRIRNIDLSVEAGGFVEYWPAEWLRTRAELRGAVIGADGLVADFSTDVVWRPDARWTGSLGARLSLADQSFMDSYYSITPAQALSSGLAQYKADAGLRSYGAGASLRYQWSDTWLTMGYVEYTRLAANPSDSPLITERGSPDQVTVGLGAKYSFRVDW
jgi:MipA family protein